jgi:hypothetical protein
LSARSAATCEVNKVLALTPLAADADTTRNGSAIITPDRRRPPRPLRGVRGAITGLMSGMLGLTPHVLHHVAFLAGTAVVAGSGGTALFGGLGLAAAVPLLIRMHRRSGTWRAPTIALAAFTLTFALSAFVIGPAISGTPSSSTVPAIDHNSHH